MQLFSAAKYFLESVSRNRGQAWPVMKFQLDAVGTRKETRERCIINARSVPGDRCRLQYITQCRTYNAGMRDNQNVSF